MSRTTTYWQAACHFCDWRQLHRTQDDASMAMKAHHCPTGKRSAGMVSMVTGVDFGVEPENLVSEAELSKMDRAAAAERQRHIEAELADG